MSLFSLSDKTAVITGASKGIGKSIAEVFARQQADVHIIDTDQEAGKKTLDLIKEHGGEAYFHKANVTDQEKIIKTFERIYQNRNRIDILVNNAGIAHIGKLEETTEKDLDKLYSVNIKGVYNCCFAGIKKMKQKGGGTILNVCSVAALMGIADRFAYSTSKGAVLSMTYSVAKDYVDQNIRCNSISPARVHTPFVDDFLKQNYSGKEKEMFEKLSKTQPIGRMGTPEEIAYLALYLCSDEAAFVTGSNFSIDGGFTTIKT